QTSVSNVISGLFLLIDRPFSINDTVQIDQTLGTIIAIDLLSTKIRTFDNLVVRLPNEALLKSTITNYTLFGVRRIEIPVQVAYSTDLGQAHDVLRGVMRDHTAVLDEPAPVVLTDLLADSGVNLLIRAWVIRTDFVQARSDLTTAVKEALEEADIQIPFPQRVIHHVNTASEPTAQPQKSVGSARIEAPEQV
ncbi:MAG: mechanosensitive ion channel family protein, partial [Persicimonas sp.]